MHGAWARSSLAFVAVGLLCTSGVAGCSGNDNADRPQFDATDAPRDRPYLDVRPRGDAGEDVEGMDASDVPQMDVEDVVPMDIRIPTEMHVRFANLVANPTDALPAFDFCARRTDIADAPTVGPLLEMNGRAAGIGWNEVSAYFVMDTGTYEFTVVAANATDCSTPILPPQANQMLPPAGSYATVAFYGIPAPDAAASLSFRASVLRDRDPTRVTSTTPPALRLFHVVPNPTRFDVGIVIDGPMIIFNTIYENIGFGEVGRGPMGGMGTDANGYHDTGAASGLTVGLRNTCMGAMPCNTPILLRVNGLETMNGVLYSAFLALRPHPTLPGMVLPGAMICYDTAPAVGGLSNCVLPE